MSGLELAGVSAGYGDGTVLHRVDLAVSPGTVHAVVGHNGAGKSTLVHTVAGLRPAYEGRVLVGGQNLTGRPAHHRSRAGVGLVPQGRRVFASLTVAEHLAIAHRPGPWTPSRVLGLLPVLAARRGHRGAGLSGGEQQLLAIARALVTQPRLLLLDEPTEGLAPRIAGQIEQLIGELASGGLTILLTAPAPDLVLAVADDLTVLSTGRVTHRLAASEVRSRPHLLTEALTLTPREGDHVRRPEEIDDRPRHQ